MDYVTTHEMHVITDRKESYCYRPVGNLLPQRDFPATATFPHGNISVMSISQSKENLCGSRELWRIAPQLDVPGEDWWKVILMGEGHPYGCLRGSVSAPRPEVPGLMKLIVCK